MQAHKLKTLRNKMTHEQKKKLLIGLKKIKITVKGFTKEGFLPKYNTSFFSGGVDSFYTFLNNKSKNIFALSLHVLVYGVVFVVLLMPFFNFSDILIFVCVNIGLHWATDFTTSRITSYFWNKKQIYNFFLTIGVDQYIHQACLISTLHFLGA